MKKIVLVLTLCFICFTTITSCHKKITKEKPEPQKYVEVIKQVEDFVYDLTETYQHYDCFGHNSTTVYSDGKRFEIIPIGRMIVVKVDEYVSDDYYEDVKSEIKKKYENDHRVNDVFINGFGTISIDCRN